MSFERAKSSALLVWVKMISLVLLNAEVSPRWDTHTLKVWFTQNTYFIQSAVEVSNLFDRVKVHLYFAFDVFSIGEKFLAEPLSKVWPPAPPTGRAKDNLIGSTNLQVVG